MLDLSHFVSSLEESEDIRSFLHTTGLSAPALCDNKTPVVVWFKYGLDFNGGRPGEEPGVLTGVVDTELLLVTFGEEGGEWTCNKYDGPLVQGCDKICSRVGLSLGLTVSIHEMRSLASMNKGRTSGQ